MHNVVTNNINKERSYPVIKSSQVTDLVNDVNRQRQNGQLHFLT